MRVAMLLENNAYPADVRVRREAESLVHAGHEVVVYAPRAAGQPRRERVRGVEVRRFRVPPERGGVAGLLAEYAVANVALHAGAAAALLRGAEVLHLHNPPDTLFPAALLARAVGRRVVFDHHDLFPELTDVKFERPALTRIAAAAERATFAAADHVLAANESHAELARGRGGKRADQVTVVRNGPPAAALAAAPDVRPGRLGDPHLVYVGAIAAQDGVDGLAEVMRRLVDDHGLSGARLTIVGEGDARPAVESALAAAGVADRTTITGWVDLDEVPGLVAAADVCVDPAPSSPLNERSTMIKVAEYLAAGKPVVAYDLLETRRTTAGAALLTPPGDVAGFASHVARLADDAAERKRLARAALERAPELTWERSERALLSAYAALAA
jgi:glycosyltransferase involved in cell wall biosynthesis